jgi:hypothetical protein
MEAMPDMQTPDHPAPAAGRVVRTTFLEEGLTAIREGHRDVVVTALGRAVEQEPDYPSLHNYAVALARAVYHQNNHRASTQTASESVR